MSKNSLSAENLKAVLWETLLAVKSKKTTPAVANSVFVGSREIMSVIRTEIFINKLAGRKPTARQLEMK